MSLDLSIGRGDNAPALTWKLPFDVAGSDFVLVLTLSGGTRSFSVSESTLTLDPIGNTVSWPVTAEQSAALPNVCTYTLRRILPGGERRFYAEGRITARDGPVGAQTVVVQVPGPQGRPGEVGPHGFSAYDSYVALGGTLTEAEWSAPASGVLIERSYAIAIGAHGQTALPISPPPTALSTLVLTINGVDYRAPMTLSASEIAVTWSGDFPLDPSDDVHVSYF